MAVLKFTHNGESVFFEPKIDTNSNVVSDLIEAKEYCNSVFLKTGNFSRYAFVKRHTTEASNEEQAMYYALKDRSVHAIGKI